MNSFLTQYQRQPKIYVDLPSKGQFYNDQIIQDSQYTNLPVFGMNTMDELMLKTPDALFSGDATVSVIKSCMPLIKDPWQLLNFDLEYLLVSVRIATYGELMPISSKCPHCKSSTDHDIELTRISDHYSRLSFKPISIRLDNDLQINLRPLTYKESNYFSKENFVLQKQILQLGDKDEEKINDQRRDLYKKLSNLNADITTQHIYSITNGSDEETDLNVIKQFVFDNDARVFASLQDSVSELNRYWEIPALNAICSNDQCGKDYTTTIEMDYSSFFGKR